MTLHQLPTAITDWRTCPDGCVSAMDIVDRTGITYRQLDYWTRTGLLTDLPRFAHASSGTNRYYPIAQLHRAATLRWLLEGGLSLQTCRAVIDELLTTAAQPDSPTASPSTSPKTSNRPDRAPPTTRTGAPPHE